MPDFGDIIKASFLFGKLLWFGAVRLLTTLCGADGIIAARNFSASRLLMEGMLALRHDEMIDAESLKRSITENGAFFIADPSIGKLVNSFANDGYPFQTVEGLTFLRAVLADERVRDAVLSLLDRPGLGMFKVFGPHPDTARAPLNRTTDELLVLAVFLCRNGSRVIIREESQKHELNAQPGGTGFLELPCEDLDRLNIRRTEIVANEGGLIIADGRLFSTVVQGVVIWVGFAAEKELNEWGKMPWPNSKPILDAVAEMEDEDIRLNFKFLP